VITYLDPSSRFVADAPTLAIVPLACEVGELALPAHSQDPFLVEVISQQVAAAIHQPCSLVPVWPYGDGSSPNPPSPAIHLRSETLLAVVSDIVQSLYAHGVTKVAVINGPGSCTEIGALPFGNMVVKTAVRQLNYENPGLTVIWVQPFRAARRNLTTLFGNELDDEVLKKMLVNGLAGNLPPARCESDFHAAFDAICQATLEYIEKTFSQLDCIKTEHPREY
jgi:hypothetical protein